MIAPPNTFLAGYLLLQTVYLLDRGMDDIFSLLGPRYHRKLAFVAKLLSMNEWDGGQYGCHFHVSCDSCRSAKGVDVSLKTLPPVA